MKFTDTWTPQAEQDLVRFWLAARDRQAIDEAAEVIEKQLTTNLLSAGESRVGPIRLLIVEPLAVVFLVRPDDRLVKVIQVTRRS